MGIEQFLRYAMSKNEVSKIEPIKGVSTGSTLLNLACSDHPDIGFLAGKYHLFIGDSSSGKTFLTMTSLAEAANNPAFDGYDLIFDDVEGGNLFDVKKLFGRNLVERIRAPHYTDEGTPLSSMTIEEFYYNVDAALERQKPFIYILDSHDALSSLSEMEKFDETKDAYYKGKTTTGTYGDGKAKINSSSLRMILSKLQDSGSILVIINQTRDNLGFGFEKKTRSGGHALFFYATLALWSSHEGKISKTVRKKKRTIGIQAKIKIKKNRINGKEHAITVPIYYSYGIDDLGSCIDYLIQEDAFEMKKQTIKCPELDFEGTRDSLIKHVEENGQQEQIKQMVVKIWNDVEKACELKRKPKYE